MTYFNEHPEGIAAMLAGPDMVTNMRRRAERGAVYASHIAPVRTGRYLAHMKVTSGINEHGVAFGRLYNDVRSEDGYPYSLAIEYGTRHMRAQRILGRCLLVMAQ